MTKTDDYIPARGDIAWMILDPRVGHEQSGRRPVLIVSHKEMAEQTGYAIVVPITSRDKGPLFSYQNPIIAAKVKGIALPLQVRSVDFRRRKAKYIEHIRGKRLEDIAATIKVLIG